MANYPELLQRLYSINKTNGIKMGLKNMERLCSVFGNPENRFKAIHVAGTNGKGSVSTKIAKSFEAWGKKTGLYTSPHIATYRERITINGKMISEKEAAHLLEQIFKVIDEEKIPATIFEITTLLCFLHFSANNIDIGVLETGLGGRLDATNILPAPLMSIITSIDFDHMEFLGTTLEEITKEKAGIIKYRCPVTLGPRVNESIVRKFADTLESTVITVKGSFDNYHNENCAIANSALITLGVPTHAIEKGLQTLPPCRMETIESPYGKAILDVGHNPDGLKKLFSSLPQKKYSIVLGLSKSKDCSGCVSIIKNHASDLHLVCASNGRGLDPHELKDLFISHGFPETQIKIYDSIAEGVKEALSRSPQPILICGTFFIMAEARQALGIKEPIDFVELS